MPNATTPGNLINALNHITSFFREKEVKKYFSNTSWMLGEKVISMVLLLLASIMVARYLGPDSYGLLSYAISLTTLFTIATHMGLHGLAIRELVTFPEDHRELLGTVFLLKIAGAVTAFTAFMLFTLFTEEVGSSAFWIMLIASGIILFKPFEVFDFWFQSRVMARYPAASRGAATVTFTALCLLLVAAGAHILAFAFTYLVQSVITALLFLLLFSHKSHLSIRNFRFRISKAKALLSQSWMIMLGALFAMIYLKIDQVMIRWIISTQEVGIYSVAAKLSETWYFIPSLVAASLFPKLIEIRKSDNKKFLKRLQQLFDMLFMMALALAVLITFVSEPLILLLYGEEYKQASLILSIHIWAGVFIFMRAAFSKWILIENAIAFSLITQGMGAFFNIVLNLFLIPVYGGTGAAIATIISYAFASYISLVFYKKSRPVFLMMTLALFAPARYSLHLFRMLQSYLRT